MRIFENANHDFLSDYRTSYIVSGILILVATVSLVYPGLEAGIDFKGGTEFTVRTAEPVASVEAGAALQDATGEIFEVKEFGDPNTLLVRTAAGGDADALRQSVESTLQSAFPASSASIIGTYSVGPRVASDLTEKAIVLVLGALFVVLLYIFVRFDWRYAVAAVLCLAHDVVIVLGLFALLHNVTPFSLQIDQAIIAALLTIVGYSINDTVVVFDRIRGVRAPVQDRALRHDGQPGHQHDALADAADVGDDAAHGARAVPVRRRGAPRVLARAVGRDRRRDLLVDLGRQPARGRVA